MTRKTALNPSDRMQQMIQDDGAMEVEAWLVECLHDGACYSGARRVLDARKYNPTLARFWVSSNAQKEHRVTALSRPTPAVPDEAMVEAARRAYNIARDGGRGDQHTAMRAALATLSTRQACNTGLVGEEMDGIVRTANETGEEYVTLRVADIANWRAALRASPAPDAMRTGDEQ